MAYSMVEKAAFTFLRVHDALYQRTNGWIGHKVPGLPPNLLLHTVGAKSGKPRVNTLSYAMDGADYLIVASKAGAATSPAWYHNLKAHPDVTVQVGPKRFDVAATAVLPDNPDYPRLWRIVNANNSDRYSSYQKRTSRPIPVIRLAP